MSMVVSASAVTVMHEQAHDVEFTGGEAHAADGAERVSGEVEAGVPVAENVHLRALAPEQGVDAGQKLPVVEGFGEVVVRAGVQALYPVPYSALGRQHEDGRCDALGPHAPSQAVAVQPRHHDVQDEQVVNAGLSVFRAVFAVRHDLNLKTAQLQERSQPLGQQRLVLDYKYFH